MTSACVDVEIKQDDSLEEDELFVVALSSSDLGAILKPDETKITILDDDGMTPCSRHTCTLQLVHMHSTCTLYAAMCHACVFDVVGLCMAELVLLVSDSNTIYKFATAKFV